MVRNIVLIGFMGTGKTAVGRRLADRLGRPFVDTDKEIENLYDKTVPQIFSRYGEVRFRSEEAILVKKLVGQTGLVIATGGGLVLNPDNVRLLQETGIFIRLEADADTIYQRIRGKRDRPLLNRGIDLKTSLQQMMVEREGAYTMAEFSVNTGILSPWEAVETIVAYVNGGTGQ
ncbi:MAG TPA: shikimate kinase [Spirochaetia bacterium]|nr:shikimate kinase [Spirochaetia bacterium]